MTLLCETEPQQTNKTINNQQHHYCDLRQRLLTCTDESERDLNLETQQKNLAVIIYYAKSNQKQKQQHDVRETFPGHFPVSNCATRSQMIRTGLVFNIQMKWSAKPEYIEYLKTVCLSWLKHLQHEASTRNSIIQCKH